MIRNLPPAARMLLTGSALFVLIAMFAGHSRSPIFAGGSIVNGREYQGEPLNCNFPDSEYMENIGSKVDGAGMCVDTSIEMCARAQGLKQMIGFRDWAARQPGGGTPDTVERQIPAFCRAKGIDTPRYLQYTGAHPEKLLEAISKSGRPAAITYGYSPRYSGRIAHMVVCPHYSGKWGVALDNNLIGGLKRPDHMFEWMEAGELLNRIKSPNGEGWLFVWLDYGDPQDICQEFGPYASHEGARAAIAEAQRNGWKCGAPFRRGRGWWFSACK